MQMVSIACLCRLHDSEVKVPGCSKGAATLGYSRSWLLKRSNQGGKERCSAAQREQPQRAKQGLGCSKGAVREAR